MGDQVSAAEVSKVIITVIMACHNAAPFVDAAIRSVLRQTLQDIEVIVVDDCSTDDSLTRVRHLQREDNRIRLLQTARNSGPAAARNLALTAAAGDWIAVMDCDDLMHPDRLRRLLAAAEHEGADIIADDCLIFDDARHAPPSTVLGTRRKPFWVDAPGFVQSNCIYGTATALGYLKPMFRHELIRRNSVTYNELLRIAEDYDFLLRLLVGGARLRISTDVTYFYRKHGASISHRLSIDALKRMLAADDLFRSDFAKRTSQLTHALDERRSSIHRAIDYETLVPAIKKRRWLAVASILCKRPDILTILMGAVLGRLSRLKLRFRHIDSPCPSICLISRQRLIGTTNGSSTYLLSICRYLQSAGFSMHLISPSPAVFGRWPVLRMRPEMAMFARIHIRGGLRIGRMIFALDPRILLIAVATVVERKLARIGLGSGDRIRPAPYAIAVPWTIADFLFVAKHAPQCADVVIADYAFLTDAIPYALRPDSPSAVVMHDLFSSRSAQFEKLDANDSVASLDERLEFALLAQADAVIAIQADEGRTVSQRLPTKRVIVAPMASPASAKPAPGLDGIVLFVGSNTAPNVLGLRWFIDTVWPSVLREVPDAVLFVAGTVAGQFDPRVGHNVRLLGLIPDLAPIYQQAAVVISPLLVGSGLKIKLMEALGHGKATVVTNATIQGVESLVSDCVCLANDPVAFASDVTALLLNRDRRIELGQTALAAVARHFSAEACYGELRDFAVSAVSSGSRKAK